MQKKAIFLFLSGLLLVRASQAAPTPTSAFQPVDCPNGVMVTHCGYVEVPLNHAQPHGRQIQVFVAVQDAVYSSQPRPDALFYFAGGPGQSASREQRYLAQEFDFLDVVTIDQRGIGNSRPRLSCDGDLSSCAQSWRAGGVDPQYFSSAQAAQDVEYVRAALGYKQINVLGVSWGSRVVQELLQRQSTSHLRSAVMDGVISRTVSYEQGWLKVSRALNAVLDACQQDKDCRKDYPDLKSRFARGFGQLDPQSQLALLNLLSNDTRTGKIGDIPRQLDQALKTKKVAVQPAPATPAAGQLPWIEGGAHAVISCLDSTRQTTPDRAKLAWQQAGPVGQLFVKTGWVERDFRQCQALGLSSEALPTNLPFPAIPTLLMGGEFDAYTLPAWQTELAQRLPRGQSVVLKGQGHLLFYTDCGVSIIKAFLLNPGQPIPRQCAQAGRLAFR